MRSLPTRRVAASVLALAAALLLSPAAARAGEACPDADSGVTVVVDFRGAGGGIEVGCAFGAPASGFAALQAAGFSLTEVQGMPGFLCKIDGSPASEDCVNTPPADAFWSYWSASRGGSWSYSLVGGAARTPPPGTVDGWSFGAGSAPGIGPPGEAPAPTTTTTTSTTTSPTTTTTTTAAPATTSTTTTTATAGPTTTSPPTTTTVAAVTATSRPAPTTTTSTSVATTSTTTSSLPVTTTTTPEAITTSIATAPETTVAAATPTAAGDGSGGSTVVALGALAGLGAAGVTVAVRRRGER